MVTSPVIILTIFGFYTGLAVILALMGGDVQASLDPDAPEPPSILSPFESIKFFFGAIGFSLSDMPLWFNLILFLPLAITLVFILLDLIIPG